MEKSDHIDSNHSERREMIQENSNTRNKDLIMDLIMIKPILKI